VDRYEWLKDGHRLDVMSSPDRFMFITHGTLRIMRATSLDEGYYQCTASNDVGTAMSSVVRLRRLTIIIVIIIITSAKDDNVVVVVCLSVCLSVSNFVQKHF